MFLTVETALGFVGKRQWCVCGTGFSAAKHVYRGSQSNRGGCSTVVLRHSTSLLSSAPIQHHRGGSSPIRKSTRGLPFVISRLIVTHDFPIPAKTAAQRNHVILNVVERSEDLPANVTLPAGLGQGSPASTVIHRTTYLEDPSVADTGYARCQLPQHEMPPRLVRYDETRRCATPERGDQKRSRRIEKVA